MEGVADDGDGKESKNESQKPKENGKKESDPYLDDDLDEFSYY